MTDQRGRARCPACGHRRLMYVDVEFGELCGECTRLVQAMRSALAMGALLRVMREPEFIERIERMSTTFADAIRAAVGDG